MGKKRIKEIQIVAYDINTLTGQDRDVAYCTKFKEMTISFVGGSNTIITKKELETLINHYLDQIQIVIRS